MRNKDCCIIRILIHIYKAREREREKEREREREREREKERERESITKRLKVGKHNALSGDIAPGRTGSRGREQLYFKEREGVEPHSFARVPTPSYIPFVSESFQEVEAEPTS